MATPMSLLSCLFLCLAVLSSLCNGSDSDVLQDVYNPVYNDNAAAAELLFNTNIDFIVTAANMLHLSGHNALGADAPSACFAATKGRGAGVPLNYCPSGTEKSGLLCYPGCKDGYYGVGPVCWLTCPSDLTDYGVFCSRTYGKGCCCTVFGCCGCDSGYTDFGCTCTKHITKSSYGRGAGVPMICGPGEEQNGALCYPECPSGFTGAGPVCWQTSAGSSSKFPVKCNDIIYTNNTDTCQHVRVLLGAGGGTSVACLASVVAAGVTVVGWPVAAAVCGAALPEAVETVKSIFSLTGAQTCPTSLAVPM